MSEICDSCISSLLFTVIYNPLLSNNFSVQNNKS